MNRIKRTSETKHRGNTHAMTWRLTVTILTTVFVAFLSRMVLHFHSKCNMASVVEKICLAFRAGNISGPMCMDLCEFQSFDYGKCLSSVPNKKIYDANWRGQEVVLKVNMSWFEELKERQSNGDNEVVESYQNDVSTAVKTLFGDCARCNELASLLMLLGDGNTDGRLTGAEVRTFTSLLQQIEPMMLMALNNSKHTVDFYGYCGGLYVVERVPHVAAKVFEENWELIDLSFLPDAIEPLQNPMNNLVGTILDAVIFFFQYLCVGLDNTLPLITSSTVGQFIPFHVPSKHEKFKLANSLLDATFELSNNPYGLVMSCDANLHNVGYTYDFIIKFIDLDFTYPYTFVKRLLNGKNCSCDLDCWTGISETCSSLCNTRTGSCTAEMQYQDLFIVCESFIPDIFRKHNLLESDHTCLRIAIQKLGEFCSTLPVVYSVEKLKLQISAVKKRLKVIEMNSKC